MLTIQCAETDWIVHWFNFPHTPLKASYTVRYTHNGINANKNLVDNTLPNKQILEVGGNYHIPSIYDVGKYKLWKNISIGVNIYSIIYGTQSTYTMRQVASCRWHVNWNIPLLSGCIADISATKIYTMFTFLE